MLSYSKVEPRQSAAQADAPQGAASAWEAVQPQAAPPPIIQPQLAPQSVIPPQVFPQYAAPEQDTKRQPPQAAPLWQTFSGQSAPVMRTPGFIPFRPPRSSGSIRNCVNRFAYIWLLDDQDFWAWISYVSRNTVYGYRWNGQSWVYFSARINGIDAFMCV